MNPTVCRFLSNLFFQGGVISIALSIAVWWFFQGEDPSPEEKAHAERFGIFVGLWAPTLLILSNRFDRFADKAPELAGHRADIDTAGEDEV